MDKSVIPSNHTFTVIDWSYIPFIISYCIFGFGGLMTCEAYSGQPSFSPKFQCTAFTDVYSSSA